jgi:hypothetical protein
MSAAIYVTAIALLSLPTAVLPWPAGSGWTDWPL